VQPTYDVFLGHVSSDKERGVRALANELERLGLRVFLDERSIELFAPITQEVERAIAESLVFVAWYSERYPASRACQLELRRAYVAAEGAHAAGERILALNPEDGFGHIEPVALRNARIPVEGAAEAIRDRVEAVQRSGDAPLGGLGRYEAPVWIPDRRIGSPRFVGRVAESWRLHDRLQARQTSQVTGDDREMVAIVGLGGMGKSLLAEEYARSFGPAYPGGIYWLTATEAFSGGDGALLDALTVIATRAGIELEDRPDPGELRHRLALALAEGERALWVVDDLPAGLSVEQMLAWISPHERAATLVTTRSGEYGALPQVSLDVLDEHAALLLLLRELEPADEPEWEAARTIAGTLLGCHAQAVDVARAQIALRGGRSAYREFLERARRSSVLERLEHAAAITRQLPNGHEASIVATLRSAIEGLDENARDLVRLAGELAEEPITLYLAEAIAPESESPEAAADRVDVGLAGLELTSLARRAVTDGGQGAYAVHGLVSAVARHLDPEPTRASSLRERAMWKIVLDLSARGDLGDQRSVPQFLSLVSHARHLVVDVAGTDEVNIGSLATWVAGFDQKRGALSSARALREAVAVAFDRLLDEDDPDRLANKGNLAQTLIDLGEIEEARALVEDLLAERTRLLGDRHPDTLATRGTLASLVFRQGDLGSALTLQHEVLDAMKEVLGADHPRTLDARMGHAWLLHAQGDLASARAIEEDVLAAQAGLSDEPDSSSSTDRAQYALTLFEQGDLAGARAVQEKVLANAVEVLGSDHPETISAKRNLALTLRQLGDLEAARAMHLETLEASIRVLGNDHPNTLATKGNLALTLRGLAELDAARALQVETLDATVRVFGEDHPNTLTTKGNLALTLVEQGDLEEARRLNEEVTAAAIRVHGANHPATLTFKSNLAAVMREQGDWDASRELDEVVLAERMSRLGADHPATLVSKGSLARTLTEQGDLGRARLLSEEALAGNRRLHGEEHPDTLTAKGGLANVLREQGHVSRARALDEEVLALRVRAMGDEHPDTLIAKDVLARDLRLENDLAGARALQQEIADVCALRLGPDHPRTLQSKSVLAQLAFQDGDHSAARTLQEEIVASCVRVFGDEHDSTLEARNDLATLLLLQGDPNGARAILELVAAVLARRLGDGHPTTLTARSNLAVALHDQGELAAASALQAEIVVTSERVLGASHPTTLEHIGQLAEFARARGDEESARELDAWIRAVAAEIAPPE
jgi:tetratricopeptide (TPR) repeat protein